MSMSKVFTMEFCFFLQYWSGEGKPKQKRNIQRKSQGLNHSSKGKALGHAKERQGIPFLLELNSS